MGTVAIRLLVAISFAVLFRAEGCALALPDSSIAISSLAGAPSEFSLHSIIEENDENVS